MPQVVSMGEVMAIEMLEIGKQEVALSLTEGYGHKKWSNPKDTNHRIYIHRFEGKHKFDCGFFDLDKKTYTPPKKSNRKADTIEYTLDGSGDEVLKIGIGEELFALTLVEKAEVTIASNNKTTILEEGEPQQILEHLASITKSDTKIIISYGNTVEVKSKARYGNIQTQYPKLSLQVELEGGNTLSVVDSVADNVVALVEKKLTQIINDLIE